jgi:hypothetical protein
MLSPVTYRMLEPGMQAAIDLLDRELCNEKSAGEAEERQGRYVTARIHAINAVGYRAGISLLREQMGRLARGA